jgi:hypothetical protein
MVVPRKSSRALKAERAGDALARTANATTGVPPYMRLNSDELWETLRATFEDDAAFIQSLRLEDRDEAVDRSSPREIGSTIRHSLLIPYRRTDDADELGQCLEYARRVIPELRELFSARIATPEFLHYWGAFQCACGLINACYFSRGDDLGPLRSKIKGSEARSKDTQYRWVARLLRQQFEKRGSRQLAERDVAKGIDNFIKGGTFPEDFDREWFECILGADRQLRSTYCRKHLSFEQLQEYAAAPGDDLPPLIPLPTT